jgi:hypothetical protein
MKKIMIFSILLIGIYSCDEPPTPKQLEAETNRTELNNDSRLPSQNYRIYTLEGCEYILVGVGNNRWGSHKGNCKNPIHQKISRYTEWKR